MKRRILLLLLVSMSVLSLLNGCGSEDSLNNKTTDNGTVIEENVAKEDDLAEKDKRNIKE